MKVWTFAFAAVFKALVVLFPFLLDQRCFDAWMDSLRRTPRLHLWPAP